jgi:protoporphyrinogen oxidase
MRVGIVGAGVTGLTVAHELLKRGHEVTLFERGEPGGLAGGVPFPGIDGVYLDKYYHHCFKGDKELVELIAEHGFEPELMWLESKSGIFADGRSWPFRTPRDLLAFAPVGSLPHRFVMGLNLLYLKRKSDWRDLDGISCREFFERRWNATAYKTLWGPLLSRKFADACDDIPASFLWGRVRPRARSRETGKETLGYLRGGFQRLVCALVDSIRERGGTVSAGDRVEQLIPGNRPELVSEKDRAVFDRVVWTIGLDSLPTIVQDIPPDVERKARSIEYMAVTCLVIVAKRRQGEFYWLNSIDPSVSFGAVIEHTNLVSPEDYGGNHILYVLNYHRQGSGFCGLGAEAVLEKHLCSLGKVLPNFSQEAIVRMHLFRDPESCPLYNLRFSEKVPPYQGWLPNVDICGMAQVYPIDRNMNACVQNAMHYVEESYG